MINRNELIKTKVYLCGDYRYMKDFSFVFKNINIEKCIDNIYDSLSEILYDLKSKSAILIVCKYKKYEVNCFLEKSGLKRGDNYFNADDLFYLLDFPIEEISKQRSVFVWGSGDDSHQLFHNITNNNREISIAGIVDSDKDKWDKNFFGYPIYNPQEILSDKSVFFIIATSRYYKNIKSQLIELGFREDKDFIYYEFIEKKASFMLRKTIFDTTKIEKICRKPFEDVYVGEGGRLSVCAGAYINNIGENIKNSDFKNMWFSNTMNIFRLSVINGTYSFCNKRKCDYFEECQEIDINNLHYQFHKDKYDINSISKKKTYLIQEDDNRYNLMSQYDNKYPKKLMVSYDRTCNLFCRSCRDKICVLSDYEKDNIKQITERIWSVLPYIEELKVAGNGEVFASNEYKKLLFDNKLCDSIKKIGILTNGTLFTKEKWNDLEKKYSDISVVVSLDGSTKKTVEYLRRGTNFEQLKDNMEFLALMRKEKRLNFLAFNFVVQRDNYQEMVEYARMCLQWNADCIKFSKLFNWGQWSDVEFDKLSMFDKLGNMKAELDEIVQNPIFARKEVRLFKWMDW